MTAAVEAPNLRRLNGDQLRGWACALCGARLYEDRALPPITEVRHGLKVRIELWACAPTCLEASQKERRGPWL